jgi:hypothetical protein
MTYNVWFRAPLTCLNCGSQIDSRNTGLHTAGLGWGSENKDVSGGQMFELGIEDLHNGYLTLREPNDDHLICALEQWTCPVCGRAQWARLDFERVDDAQARFVSARTVPLTVDTVAAMNFISRWIDLWVKGNPGEDTDRIMNAVGHLMPWLNENPSGQR